MLILFLNNSYFLCNQRHIAYYAMLIAKILLEKDFYNKTFSFFMSRFQ